MNKTLKTVLLVILVLVVLGIGLPLAGGILSSVNPNQAIQMAEQKKAENKSTYIPEGYSLVKQAEARKSEFGTLYITEMTNQTRMIRITQGKGIVVACKGTTKTIANTSVCYKDASTAKATNIFMQFKKGTNEYQLETTDKTITDEVFGQIIDTL